MIACSDYLNNRHYDPTTGVFVSVDPLVTLTGQPYVYGAANPVTYSDPDGLCPISGEGSAEACRQWSIGEGMGVDPGVWNEVVIPISDGEIPRWRPDRVSQDYEGSEPSGWFPTEMALINAAYGSNFGFLEEAGLFTMTYWQNYRDGYDFSSGAGQPFSQSAFSGWQGLAGFAATGLAVLGGARASRYGLCSFDSSTEVLMADGSTKQISSIVPGDWVIAEDPETGERGERQVTHRWVHDDTLVELSIGDEVVTTTEDHPFWNATDQAWERADQLDPGDRVLSSGGELFEVGGVDVGSARVDSAYNLTVSGIHTFFVLVGDAAILVHNTCASASNYRSNFLKANPNTPAGHQIHHALPQRYREIMQRVGVNIDENQFLRGFHPDVHSKVTTEWSRWHRSLGGRMPTAQEITNFSYRIDDTYGSHFVFSV